MNNPICNTVFDSRDLIEYLEEIQSEIVEAWNDKFQDDEEKQVSFIEEIEDKINHEHEDYEPEFDFEELVTRISYEDYSNLVDFCDELESYSEDFRHGSTIIHEDYFQDYCEELVKDCGYISKDFPSWIEIDWESTANNMSADYTTVSYEGSNYYIR